jgi:hypothetical protein
VPREEEAREATGCWHPLLGSVIAAVADHIAPDHVGGFHVLTIAFRSDRIVDANVGKVHATVRLLGAPATIRIGPEPVELLVPVEEVRGGQTRASFLAKGVVRESAVTSGGVGHRGAVLRRPTRFQRVRLGAWPPRTQQHPWGRGRLRA